MMTTDEIPSCDIRIDKEGTWYYQGLPIINRNIYLHLNQCLSRDTASGKYVLCMGEEKCLLEVEDTPFVIQEVCLKSEEGAPVAFWVKINDGTEEPLDTASLRIAADNVAYGTIKQDFCEARFTRAAWHQLAGYVQQDREGYYLSVGNVKTYLKLEHPVR